MLIPFRFTQECASVPTAGFSLLPIRRTYQIFTASPFPQNYSKTVGGWLALAQVVRYHQPRSRRVYEIEFHWEGYYPVEVEEAMTVVREVIPMLTSRGGYRNVYQVRCFCGQTEMITLMKLLVRSHITHLDLHPQHAPAGEPYVDALTRLFETGRVRTLYLSLGPHQRVEQLERVVEAINTLPAARSLTAVVATVSTLPTARALLGLAASTASHALERIFIDAWDIFGPSDPGVDASPYRLLAIPTLRVLGIGRGSRHLTQPVHVSVLRDCVRARAESGAAPLHTLAFRRGSVEAEKRVAEEIEPLMQVESPATSARVMEYLALKTLVWNGRY